jgi:hypothetical protein
LVTVRDGPTPRRARVLKSYLLPMRKKQRAAMVTKEILVDAVRKPYYRESKFSCQRRVATTTLFGLAPVRSARVSAANKRATMLASLTTDVLECVA